MYDQLTYLHLASVGLAGVLGTYLMIVRKGDSHHKKLGKIYMVLMLVTASVSLIMPAQIGFTLFNHFGPIHLLSFLAIISVVTAYLAIKQGNISLHQKSMIGLYFGGVIIAGAFTLMPGRLLNTWFFG